MANQENEIKSDYPKPMSILMLVFWTGLFGGVFWSTLGYIAHLLNFTEIHPHIILEPWALGVWKKKWLGTVISILMIGILSVGAAFVYYGAFRKLKGIWPGLVYGLSLFLLVFLVLNPLFPGMAPFFNLNRDTVITSICLYAVYGIFIGYSISYEYQNQTKAEKETAT